MVRRALVFGAVAWCVLLAVNRSLVEVAGHSMAPTLRPGQRLVTLPVPPARLDPDRRLARRLIVPGRVVVVVDPAPSPRGPSARAADAPAHLVVKRVRDVAADGSVWVEGDDPARSTDSRTWGRLEAAAVRRVVVGAWPWAARAPR
jgi:signal peptidase I